MFGTGLILLAAAGCAGEDPSQSAPQSDRVAAPPSLPKAQVEAIRAKSAGEAASSATAAATNAVKGDQKVDGGSGPKVEGPAAAGDKGSTAGAGGPSNDQLAAIKELPADEQPLAIKQNVCPVSGEALGSMGKPFKVSAEGRSFYLCCKSCEKELKADPKAVLAKLDQKKP
jgi:hypothetical protein